MAHRLNLDHIAEAARVVDPVCLAMPQFVSEQGPTRRGPGRTRRGPGGAVADTVEAAGGVAGRG